ncbi:hypothetical protein FIU97_14545 [Roseivivax sp. THAF40]|uniref:hypothetical protein n=1 Tax=Roseivivax sp. THAF40 TaxID=2587858 RepID=UPI001267DC5D|nr:hypothetical protein [Roseivivax sp. THAF40]QFT47798.1 hypothetical protein FIU97_14545 [Roseivivax sp. THAF40]
MTGLMNKVLSFTGYKSQFQAKPVAEPEVLAETPLPMVGLFSLLSDEQKSSAVDLREEEGFGPEEYRRRHG